MGLRRLERGKVIMVTNKILTILTFKLKVLILMFYFFKEMVLKNLLLLYLTLPFSKKRHLFTDSIPPMTKTFEPFYVTFDVIHVILKPDPWQCDSGVCGGSGRRCGGCRSCRSCGRR